MKWIINNYHGGEQWIYSFADKADVVLYDKKEKNKGSNIYDYMDYIVENYDNLPDVMLFGKSNMLTRHITLPEFNKLVVNRVFTPLLTQNHQTDGVINFYNDGIYWERNDSWYCNEYPRLYHASYESFSRLYDLPNPEYLPFAPGACYIVPKENILKRDKQFYKDLREIVSHDANPAEAHMVERSLYTIWS